MRVVARVDQLCVYAHLAAGALHASFKQVRDAKLLRDLAQITRCRVFVLRYTGTTDHFQVRDLGEIGQDFVLNAFSEISVVRVAAQIIERQNGDGFISARVGPGPNGILLRRYKISCATSTEEKQCNRKQRADNDDVNPRSPPRVSVQGVRNHRADNSFGTRLKRPRDDERDRKAYYY